MVTGQAPQTAHTYPLDDVLGRHAHHNPQCQLILLSASADSIHGGHVWGWSSEAVLATAEPPGLAMHSWRQILLWMTAAPAAQQILCSLQVSSSTLPPHTLLPIPALLHLPAALSPLPASPRLGLKAWPRVRPKERRGEEEADVLVIWLGTEPGTAEGPGATLRRSFSAFRRSTSS